MIYNTEALKKTLKFKRETLPYDTEGNRPFTGTRLVNTNLYVYKDGMVHNEHGPAVINMTIDGKVTLRHYYLNDKKLSCDDIVVKMIKRRDKE